MKRLPLSVGIILVFLGLSQSECPQGWFGSSCQYKCRCADQKCEAFGGNCLDGVKCMRGWFGSACQYADLAQTNTETTSTSLITDGNENTCLNANEENEISLSLTGPLHLSWFRVHVRDSYYMNKLKIQFKQQSNSSLLACENKRTALVSDTALDIHCDLAVAVIQVILTGETVQSLCSFHISGGRNVALKQNTTQSSLYDSRSHAFKAVDGDTSGDFEKGDCTHTAHLDPKPTWNVTLSNPASVNRYVVYNRIDGTRGSVRLQGFIVTSFDPAGAQVFRFNDTAPTPRVVYTVTSVPTEVQTVSIRAVKNVEYNRILLTLCEVEVYGDSVCESGLYGRDCEHKCNCANSNDPCFVSTGGCPSGCAPGYQGVDCSQECPQGWFGSSCQYKCRCTENKCEPIDGNCRNGSQCLEGWFGPACQYECPQGWFGSSCQYKCHCTENKCEPIDGNCRNGSQCLPGWFGPACQYVDLAQNLAMKPGQLRLATDGNETTCMSANELVLPLKVPFRLSWFRVHVKDPYYMNKLKIQFWQESGSPLIACENNRTALVSDTALDTHCDLDVEVTGVYLTGETLHSLCSFYISGGRNVALKQTTAQSSLHDYRSHASNAVDGDTTSWFDRGTCTHTALNDINPSWNVTLSHPAAVNRYVIYNRNDGVYTDQRLQGFILRGYDPAGAAAFFFNDIARTEQEVYTVTSVATQIQTVSIRAVKPSNDGNIVLTLCEVEIYGDSVCEPGLYGRECEHKCACTDSKDTCFVSTGGCPSGCPPGYRGEDCSQGCTASPSSLSPCTRCSSLS